MGQGRRLSPNGWTKRRAGTIFEPRVQQIAEAGVPHGEWAMTAGSRNPYGRGEVIADGIVHAVGLAAAVIGARVLIAAAVLHGTGSPPSRSMPSR